MGLFSKSKTVNAGSMPPAPMPPMASPGMDRLNASPSEISRQAPILSAPPIPSRNSLDDIKSQVVSSSSSQRESQENSDRFKMPEDVSMDGMNANEDSLFDFSTLDLPDSVENNSEEDVQTVSQLPVVSRTNNNISSQQSFVDTNVKSNEHLSFISNKNRLGKTGETDSIFVTTSQFKSFIEIVEQVRVRVKESSDRHLRLLDIKSEEDREYEALRKDFQYVEDKLYEVDSLIFDK